MIKKHLIRRKYLAVGIILLFIFVFVAPTFNFNTVKASQEDDLVEVTTQVCSIKGFGDTTMKLTREQFQNLEEYLIEFRARLNQTSTREEAIPIFKEAMVELDGYGLLPEGMNIEQVQRLVIGNNRNTDTLSLFPNFINVFCLLFAVTAEGENPEWFYLTPLFLLSGILIGFLVDAGVLSSFAFLYLIPILAIGYFSPLKLMHLIAFTDYDISLTSLGLNGLVMEKRNNLAILGFTGLSIQNHNTGKGFLLGFSLALDNTKE